MSTLFLKSALESRKYERTLAIAGHKTGVGKIVISLFLLMLVSSTLFAQGMVFTKRNGVLISKPLPNKQWNAVKHYYIPDSLKYIPLTLVEYTRNEILSLYLNAYRTALLRNGVDSSKAYSAQFLGYSDAIKAEWPEKLMINTINRVKKNYKGELRIKKTSEIDSSDRYLLKLDFINTAYSENGGWVSLSKLRFEDRKLEMLFPLLMREPKRFFENLVVDDGVGPK